MGASHLLLHISTSLRRRPHVVAALLFLTTRALRDTNEAQTTVGVSSRGQAWKLSTDATSPVYPIETEIKEEEWRQSEDGQNRYNPKERRFDPDSERQALTWDEFYDKHRAKGNSFELREKYDALEIQESKEPECGRYPTCPEWCSPSKPPDGTEKKSAGWLFKCDHDLCGCAWYLETHPDYPSLLRPDPLWAGAPVEAAKGLLSGSVGDDEEEAVRTDIEEIPYDKIPKTGVPYSMSSLSDSAKDLYQLVWAYNPFRLIVGHETQTIKRDDSKNACGTPAEYIKKDFTVGEKAMCNLRYIVLTRCNLPEDTCVTCTCAMDDPNCVGLQSCWQELPKIFFKYYVAVAAVIILGHLVLSPLLTRGYDRCMKEQVVASIVKEYIGTHDNHPKKQALRIYLLVIQIVASSMSVILFCILGMFEAQIFPWKRDFLSVSEPWIGWLQLFMNIQMLVNYYLTWMKNGFAWNALLTANAIIDVLTVHQTMVNKILYDAEPLYEEYPWLSFDKDQEFLFLARPNMNWHWLRSYRCLTALLEIQDMGVLRHFTPVAQQVMKSGLRLWALVTCFCGLMTFMEYIGHDFELNSKQAGRKNLGECQVESSMHDNLACIPFLVGIYWVFTTISTVGYGDFVPHSAITYIYVIVVIVLGVTFFSVESGTLIDVMELENHGLGPAAVKGSHVVLTGGAMRDVDEDVLYAFLIQLFHGSLLEQGYVWPEVVVHGKVADPDDVNRFLEKRLTGEMRRNITFCNGDPLKPEGVEQAKIANASFVFILPSSKTEDWDAEDEYNMHVALSVKSLSRAAYVLVLFRPGSLKMAIMSGLHPAQCCCMNRMRTAIMSQSVRVRGWPQLLNLMTCTTTSSAEGGKAYCKEILLPDDYIKCCANSAWGFALSKHAAGRSFRDLAMEMYEATGSLPICAQVDGQVRAAPIDRIMDPNTIVYCISASEPRLVKAAERFVAPNTDWGTIYVETREATSQSSSLEEIAKTVHEGYVEGEAAATSEEDMQTMLEKCNTIIAEDPHFCVAVMPICDEGKLWPLLTQFIDKFGISDSEDENPLKGMSIIALVPEIPPQSVTDYLKGVETSVRVALVHGDWTKPDVLRQFGVEQCKTLVCFPIRPLRADPANDSKTLTLLRLLNRMKLRGACFVLVELTSGMSGAHMMPRPPAMIEHGQEYLQPSASYLMEEAYNPFCAAGSIWVPRSLMGTVARSYYTNGLLEVLQAVTYDGKGMEEVRVEQVHLPKMFFGQKYKELVLAGLFGSVGPAPVLVLGVLRETLYSEAVLLNAPPDSRLLESDLVIVLATGEWAVWAQQEGLRCLGGRDNRKI